MDAAIPKLSQTRKMFNLLKAVFRSFSLSLRFAFGLTIIMVAFGIISSLLPILQARIMGDVINKIVENLASGGGVVPLILIAAYSLIWAFGRLLSIINRYLDKRWGLFMEEGLEMLISRKRMEVDIAHYEDANFQNLLERAFNRGPWPISNLAQDQTNNLSNIAVLIVASIVAANLNPTVYLVVLLTLLPSFYYQVKYGSEKWHIWAENSPRQRMYSTIKSHAMGRVSVVQVKLLQAKDIILNRIQSILIAFRNDQLKVDNSRLLTLSLADLVVASGFAYSFYLIVQDVNTGLIGVGELVLLIAVLGQFIGAMNSFLSDIAGQYEAGLFAIDIFEFLDTKPRVVRAENPIPLNLKSAPEIEFKNVWFRYEGQESWVLKGTNLKIIAGEKVALVGDNGAGKTTLVKLLTRVYDPTRGDILINGINLKEVDPDEWNSYLAILLQDYHNYEFPVWESIAMGRSNKAFSKKRAVLAAELASADDFITNWPKSYDTQIGREFEGGVDPSKGQDQKIAIARTIYRDGLVVVLDEPTASVDAKSEEKIFDQMEKTAAGKTLILISHRFNTVAGVDRIVVFKDGKIVESGAHKELLVLDGHYAKMWHSQAKHYLAQPSV